jgi:hypothetical protein
MITHYQVKLYVSCFRKKNQKKRFFLSKSMPNFNFAELILPFHLLFLKDRNTLLSQFFLVGKIPSSTNPTSSIV